MDQKPYHTRAATRGGVYPAPKPLYSPVAFGTIQLGAEEPLIDLSTRAVAYMAARPSPASAGVSPVLETGRLPGASRVGEFSSALTTLTPSSVDAGSDRSGSASEDEDGGWTAVTRKTARSHRERRSSNGSVHTSNNINTSRSNSPEYENESTSSCGRDD